MNLAKHTKARRVTDGSKGSSTAVAPLKKGKLQVHRFVIPYRVYGAAEDTLVFINGIQQSMAMWHSFVRRFEPSYRIVLFDNPHQGTSRIVSGSSTVTLDEQVEILDAVVKATSGATRPTICSASWGGVVALAYAARHPDRLRSLILASMGMRANQAMIELITKGLAMPSKDRVNGGRDLDPRCWSRTAGRDEGSNIRPVSTDERRGVGGFFSAWLDGHIGARFDRGCRSEQSPMQDHAFAWRERRYH